jgi:hypothetical protein
LRGAGSSGTRPSSRSSPWAASPSWNWPTGLPPLFAGHLRGRAAIVSGGRRPVVLQFDADGGQTHEDTVDLDDRLRRTQGMLMDGYDEWEMLTILRREHGFELGPVFVREFTSEEADLSVIRWGMHEDVIEDPNDWADGDEHESRCT